MNIFNTTVWLSINIRCTWSWTSPWTLPFSGLMPFFSKLFDHWKPLFLPKKEDFNMCVLDLKSVLNNINVFSGGPVSVNKVVNILYHDGYCWLLFLFVLLVFLLAHAIFWNISKGLSDYIFHAEISLLRHLQFTLQSRVTP